MPVAQSKCAVYTEKVDLYNFAMLLWQLMSRQVPYVGRHAAQVVREVLRNNLRPEFPASVPNEVRALAASCWATAEDTRPSAEAVVVQLATIAALSVDPALPTPAAAANTADESTFNEYL